MDLTRVTVRRTGQSELVKNRFRELSMPEPAAKRGFEGFYEDPSGTKRERTQLKVVVADNPVNFESIHCCGFLHRVKSGSLLLPLPGEGRFS